MVESKSYSDSHDTVNFALQVAGGTATVANTNILATSYRPRRRPCVLRVTVALVTGTIFRAIINDGTNRTFNFNNGAALVANSGYVFDLPIGGEATEPTVNFQTSAIDTIAQLHVEEIDEAM